LQVIVLLLFLANTINVGADLSGMADSAKLLLGGPAFVYVIAFGLICILGIVFVHYDHYVMVGAGFQSNGHTYTLGAASL
jgi:hypothetical protein